MSNDSDAKIAAKADQKKERPKRYFCDEPRDFVLRILNSTVVLRPGERLEGHRLQLAIDNNVLIREA